VSIVNADGDGEGVTKVRKGVGRVGGKVVDGNRSEGLNGWGGKLGESGGSKRKAGGCPFVLSLSFGDNLFCG
jgi:hypothetical protein